MSTAARAAKRSGSRWVAGVVVGFFIGVVLGAASVGAGAPSDPIEPPPDPRPTVSAPTVELERYQVQPGDRVTITIAGFTGRGVAAAVCGNDALRGSADCNMPASEGIETDRDGTPASQVMTIVAPPVPCPCIVRVASSDNTEVAYADITLIGHPTAPVSPGERQVRRPLSVSIEAVEVAAGAAGWLRGSLGGSVDYDVTVTVRNDGSVDAEGVSIEAAVGDDEDDVERLIDMPAPGVVLRGQTWQHTERVRLSSPVFGQSVWWVDVASDGPTVRSVDVTSHLPGLLLLGLAVLAIDLVILLVRVVLRARQRGEPAGADGEGEEVDLSDWPVIDVDDEPPVGAGVG